VSQTNLRTTRLPSGETVTVLGQGTWHLGEDPRRRADELAALRLGLDLGMTLIDTAEMYGGGAAEELVAEAIKGRRAHCPTVSPTMATRY
jgi:aryl-alcohol dehydrogenase-like predicted oxidoreductase